DRELLALKRKAGMLDGSCCVGVLSFLVAKDMAHFGIVEHRCVKIDGLFCSSTLLAHEHQSGRDLLLDFAIGHEHHLPGKTVPVLRPAVSFAEWVRAKLHES